MSFQHLDQLDAPTKRSVKQKLSAAGRVAKMQQQTLQAIKQQSIDDPSSPFLSLNHKHQKCLPDVGRSVHAAGRTKSDQQQQLPLAGLVVSDGNEDPALVHPSHDAQSQPGSYIYFLIHPCLSRNQYCSMGSNRRVATRFAFKSAATSCSAF